MLPLDSVRYRVGTPVKITRGKHAGRLGRVTFEEHLVIYLIEDETSKEVSVADFYPILLALRDSGLQIRVHREDVVFYQSGYLSTVSTNRPFSKPVGRLGCVTDHRVSGFDNQRVYVWYGQYKGKLGRLRQVGGGVARVNFDSAIRGSSIQYIQADYLIAYVCRLICGSSMNLLTFKRRCGCTVGDGKQPTWTDKEYADIPSFFDEEIMSVNLVENRANVDHLTVDSQYHSLRSAFPSMSVLPSS